MKRVGDRAPKTLIHLDSRIHNRELRLEKSYTTDEISKYKNALKKAFDKFDFGMNIPEKYLQNCFDEHFKNQFESGHSGGHFEMKVKDLHINRDNRRLCFTVEHFGGGTLDEQLHVWEYEKYGNLLDHDIKESFFGRDRGGATSYGRTQVRFKKDKVTATFTVGDSLGGGIQPSLCSDPQLCSISNNKIQSDDIDLSTVEGFRTSLKGCMCGYLELQYHGKLKFDAVESVCFPEKPDPSYSSLIKEMKGVGVKVYYADRDNESIVEL